MLFRSGTGATVGKYLGPDHMMKGGLGAFAVEKDGVRLGAVVAVNCLGDVFDYETNEKVAGLRTMDTVDAMSENIRVFKDVFKGNTTIGCLVTNAKLTKTQATKLAGLGHNGYARAIRPVHTSADGDTIYTMASGIVDADHDALGAMASEVMARAILTAVREAKTAYGVPAAADLAK